MASTARLMRLNSLTDSHELEAAARAKMKAEEKEREKRASKEEAQRVAEEGDKQNGNWGGLSKMVGEDEYGDANKESPDARRSGDVAYPVSAVSVGVKSSKYKAPPSSGGGLFSMFSKPSEPTKQPEAAPPEPEANNEASELPPPPLASGEPAQLIIAKLFEQLAAERERGDRLELQGESGSPFRPRPRACSRSRFLCSPALLAAPAHQSHPLLLPIPPAYPSSLTRCCLSSHPLTHPTAAVCPTRSQGVDRAADGLAGEGCWEAGAREREAGGTARTQEVVEVQQRQQQHVGPTSKGKPTQEVGGADIGAYIGSPLSVRSGHIEVIKVHSARHRVERTSSGPRRPPVLEHASQVSRDVQARGEVPVVVEVPVLLSWARVGGLTGKIYM